MRETAVDDERELADKRLECALVRGLAGDALAYREFLESLTTLLQGFFRKRLPQYPGDLDDLVQEVLLAVHHRRASFSGAVPVTAWIHAIARYKFVDWLRAKGRDKLFEPLLAHHDAAAPASNEIDALHARWDLGALLALLPVKQRLPIIYVKLHGLSVQEAASLTGMTEAAVKVAVHRGLKAMTARSLEIV